MTEANATTLLLLMAVIDLALATVFLGLIVFCLKQIKRGMIGQNAKPIRRN